MYPYKLKPQKKQTVISDFVLYAYGCVLAAVILAAVFNISVFA